MLQWILLKNNNKNHRITILHQIILVKEVRNKKWYEIIKLKSNNQK